MSITVYEKIPNGLYPTGQRTVSTFPSGLIRVDQTFVCKTSAAATNRATLAVGSNFPGDSAPALDGLKIFPEVQERRRDDGFTEFIVSAYGRMNTVGQQLIASRVSIFIYQYQLNGVQLTQPLVENSKTLNLNYVVKIQENLYKDPTTSSSPSVVYSYINDGPNTTNPPTQTSVWAFDSSKTSQYGDFIEVDLNFYSLSSLRWQQWVSNE